MKEQLLDSGYLEWFYHQWQANQMKSFIPTFVKLFFRSKHFLSSEVVKMLSLSVEVGQIGPFGSWQKLP